jgi:hypothetical protein
MASDLPEQLEVTSIVFKDYVDEGLPPLDNFVSTSSTLDVKTLPEGGLLVRRGGKGRAGSLQGEACPGSCVLMQ